LLYVSVIVSALISLWFVALLVGHTIKRRQHTSKKPEEQQRDTVEMSDLTASRHWSLSKEEELPNDVRVDQEFTSFRIDPTDVMQVRTLAHGDFAMISLVYLGDKQAVMKKVSIHSQGQDREQMLAFMDEIRVCAKLDHPKVVGFLGIMWASLSDLSAIVEYAPRGSLSEYLKDKKSARKSARSTFTWLEASNESPSKLSFALQISEALVYLQSFAPPVIHGHLRGDSVLLGSEWEVKLNRLGYRLDTPSLSVEDRAWVAPEVLTGGLLDEKSDIYSFGVVLSELDRCKLPFSRKASRRQSVDGGTALKPKFRDDCPPEVLDIAQSCLQGGPADRPTAMELYYSLRQLQRSNQGQRRTSTDVK
jgi:serine/threonine protein kinase